MRSAMAVCVRPDALFALYIATFIAYSWRNDSIPDLNPGLDHSLEKNSSLSAMHFSRRAICSVGRTAPAPGRRHGAAAGTQVRVANEVRDLGVAVRHTCGIARCSPPFIADRWA